MGTLFETFWKSGVAINRVAADHPVGLFVLVLAVLAFGHAILGLGRTRQWIVLPVVFGLTALGGFLLNPFADANTPADIRRLFTSYETLTLLCIAQVALLGASLVFGLRLDGVSLEGRDDFYPALCLAIVHTVPTPIVLIAMLLLEQGYLAGLPGARPEWVGRNVGLFVASVFTAASAVAMIVPSRWLALPHHVLSIALLMASIFLPTLEAPLPTPMFYVDVASLWPLWQIALAFLAIVLLGLCRLRRPQWLQPNHLVEWFTTLASARRQSS